MCLLALLVYTSVYPQVNVDVKCFCFAKLTVNVCFPEVEKNDERIDGEMNEGAQQGAAEVCVETTVPKLGQNLW